MSFESQHNTFLNFELLYVSRLTVDASTWWMEVWNYFQEKKSLTNNICDAEFRALGIQELVKKSPVPSTTIWKVVQKEFIDFVCWKRPLNLQICAMENNIELLFSLFQKL